MLSSTAIKGEKLSQITLWITVGISATKGSNLFHSETQSPQNTTTYKTCVHCTLVVCSAQSNTELGLNIKALLDISVTYSPQYPPYHQSLIKEYKMINSFFLNVSKCKKLLQKEHEHNLTMADCIAKTSGQLLNDINWATWKERTHLKMFSSSRTTNQNKFNQVKK